jgi:hypothetical protein
LKNMPIIGLSSVILEKLAYSDILDIALLREIYKNRCIICRRETIVVHEIIPRSLAPATWEWWINRVLLCIEHHDQVHRDGALNWRVRLKEFQAMRLLEYYGFILGDSDAEIGR